jgi:hypothetical protein
MGDVAWLVSSARHDVSILTTGGAELGWCLGSQPGSKNSMMSIRPPQQGQGQLSAAIQAEVKRGELRRFYVKQVESGDAGEFDRMTDEELREYIAGQDKILASLEGKPKTKH